MPIQSNIKRVKHPKNYPFRIATPDDPKSPQEILRDASIATSVAELRDIEVKLGRRRENDEYLELMKKVVNGEMELEEIEKMRISLLPNVQTKQEKEVIREDLTQFIKKM